MSEREFSKISGLPVAIQPIASNTIVEIETADGQSFHAPFSALGGMPASHGSTHQDGGSDEIGTEFPTANAIPKADDAGQLTDWIADASTSVKGKVQLAANNESAANKAVQSNDTRMSNARMPTAHAASHIGGPDDLGLGTAALLDVGVADGVCGLDSSGKVSSSNLPSYVDDVIEVANYAALPVAGETGKIYVTLDDNLTYRWTGSAYVEISKSLALGETSSTAYRGDHGKTAYDHSQAAHAPSDADKTQSAISGAGGKTTPSDNDILALLDSDASNALKKLLWSNVKATLKTYFDTLYTASGGDTPANILAKLLTVDGPTSGIYSQYSADADKISSAGVSTYAPGFSGNLNDLKLGRYYYIGYIAGTTLNMPPGVTVSSHLKIIPGIDDNNCAQVLFNRNARVSYTRYLFNGTWQAWAKDFGENSVGSGWATALGASKYSLGTRDFTSQSITSGTYIIPEGEYWCSFALQPTSNGQLQINDSTSNWQTLAFYQTSAAAETFRYGIIRSDGTNLRVLWIAGEVQIKLIRIG